MRYQVIIPKPVQKQLDDLPKNVHERVLKKLVALQENPRPPESQKLKGYEREYRIRVGDYRVRYEIEDGKSLVLILSCKHRKGAYRG